MNGATGRDEACAAETRRREGRPWVAAVDSGPELTLPDADRVPESEVRVAIHANDNDNHRDDDRENDREIDRQLIGAVRGGDRDALAQLYDRHAPVMLGVAVRILGSRAEAEDLIHDVFLEAWNKASTHDAGRGSVRAWLLMRVRSRGIDRVRALGTARRYGLAQRAEPTIAVSTPPNDCGPDGRRAVNALAGLPQEQRVVLESAYFEGLSHREIADRENIPIGTVKSRMSAALDKLRTTLGVTEGAK